MPSEVILPRVDMDMVTGKIARWHVEPGAKVSKGQPLFDIETDKAAMEIEAPASGTIQDLAIASAADIPVGSVVAWIYAEGETATDSRPRPATVEVAEPRFDSVPPPPRAEAPRAEGEAEHEVALGTAAAADELGDQKRATPMARRLARAHGLDLSRVTGTGPRGRIQVADIEAAAAPAPPPVAPPPVAPAPVAAAAVAAPTPSPAPAPFPALPPGLLPTPRRGEGAINIVRLRESEGRPTLLIHGFGADLNTWRPYLGHAASRGLVLGLDLPGHGGSPLGRVADFAALVDAVADGLGAAGLGAVDVVGHSLGGAVATALTARGVLDVRSLLLLAPAGLGPDINGGFLRGFLGATSEASLTPWLHQLVADPGVIAPAFVRATLQARNGTSLVADQQAVAAALFPDDTQAFSVRAELARLSVPTRVVVGTADRIIPSYHAAVLPPLVALHRLSGIGHMPQFEASATVAALQEQTRAAK